MAPIDLTAGALLPEVCGRRRCRVGIERERRVVPVLLARPAWLGTSEIARSAGLAAGTVSALLARMVRRGWVVARRDAGRRRPWSRRVEYRLTDEGVSMARLLLGCAVALSAGAAR